MLPALLPLTLLSLTPSLGCGGDAADPDAVNVDPEAIANGTPLDPQDGEQVQLSVSFLNDHGSVQWFGNCSGSMLTNEWILTAGHCIYPGYIPVIDVLRGTERRSTSEVTTSPSDSIDVALVHLPAGLSVHGNSTSFRAPVAVDPPSSLHNKYITAYGYGGNNGLTWGRFLVQAESSVGFAFSTTNSSGQTIVRGDSGGGSYLRQGSVSVHVGTHSNGNDSSTSDMSSGAVWRWIYETIYPNTPLVCHGIACTNTQSPLADYVDSTVTWDPCHGGLYGLTAKVDLESGYDFLYVTFIDGFSSPLQPRKSVNRLTSVDQRTWFAKGAATVRLTTDYSNPSTSLFLQAICF